ncbi:MAG: M20/M25/M40 family metallo-hydrolase [Acidobacteria bacterium]|nr:M20/M25/M40 family metallo-hydrolase [Acidobacteriota bacterium]MBI3425971.1 M20/M25/M40 family metallo-hydrolase [Acidobacteriota bacterium]
MNTKPALLTLLLLTYPVVAQTSPAAQAARQYRQQHEHEIMAEYTRLLAIPNVASDLPNIRRNAALIVELLQKRGVKTQLLELPDVPPVVYGEINTPGATRTLIFYAHYDGQPVEPAKWVGGDPFKPILRSASLEAGGKDIPFPAKGQPFDPEWRLYARSTGDDKAPIITICAALDAMRANNITPQANLKFFFEGEEEAGSAHLEQFVAKYKDLLKADAWLICDGPVDQTRRQQIYFGARGVTGLEVTVYGPRRELHSGHYGNWAPNPALMLAKLLASMKDDDGRVLIKGYYDGIEPLSATELRAFAEAPDNDALLKRELGLGWSEGGGKRLSEMLNLPSLNIRGFVSSSVGATARNVVPSTATASLDIRLVKGLDHRRAVDLVVEHIRAQGYYIVEADPDDATRLKYPKIAKVMRQGGYNASKTSMDLPISQAIIAAVASAVESTRGPVIKMPTLGGSVPLYIFTDHLKTPCIGVPIANHDNNQHSANENMRLQNLWDGIETMAVLLTMK